MSKVALPGRFTNRRVGALGGCSGGRENVLTVGKLLLRVPSARRRKAPRRPQGRRGAGHTVAAARLQVVL